MISSSLLRSSALLCSTPPSHSCPCTSRLIIIIVFTLYVSPPIATAALSALDLRKPRYPLVQPLQYTRVFYLCFASVSILLGPCFS
ncbi:hypothetical protein B0H17DRAFT_1027823 [Mycena rosella]|uniref:Uncharacterized protein n=1 Tax=Mycena rosella TaxID=1033263 RepID=A0AAD7H2Z8_MYCRO|nr:hypothetical protein B0H17DRAFT_1027823 [Mycena rosella]